MKYTLIIFPMFLFTSCTSIANIGIIGIVVIFGLMLLLFAAMFYMIAKRKKQGEKSLVKFNNDVYIALNKLNTPLQKINMLKSLVNRINEDEKYKKDPEWRDKVLVKIYMHMATVYYQMGEEMETLNVCSRIIELDSNDGMAYYNRGSIYSNMGLYEKALQDLDKTVELLPDYASAYNNRGLVHEKMEHYPEALADFDKAALLEDSPIVYYNRGNTYYELEEYEKALADYQSSLEMLDADTQSELVAEIKTAIESLKKKIN